MDKISVVIPVYNVERYLKQCLDSILTQTYTNLGIIIVDDKSPDKCPEIIDEYAKQDSRVKVIHNEENETFKAQNKNLLENAKLYAKYLNDAKLQKDVYFLGRLGDYKYYNMDLAIGRAIELFEEVCK